MEKITFKRKEKRKRVFSYLPAKLLFLLYFSIQNLQLSAQVQMLSLTLKNVSMHTVLMEIKKQSGKNIIFNNNLIDKYNNESIELKNVTLEEALKKALEGKNLGFKIVDNVIIIEPHPEKPTLNKPATLFQNIKGRVFDAETNAPLIGSTIVILESTPVLGVITDLEGNYKISNVPVGRCNIQISYMGYKPAIFSEIAVTSGKEVVLNVGLKQSVTQMNEVTIKPGFQKDKALNSMATVSARSFTIEETERFAGSWGDPARMATNYAGVNTAGDQRNDIIIRGNSPVGLLWQLEDLPIPSPNHFDVLGTTGGPVGMLNNNLLARSDFFTSAFPSEYGNAFSGVFDLKMRNGNKDKHEFLTQLGFNGIECGAEGPLSGKHKSSYIINARYSMLGLVRDLLWVEGLPQYKDASFKLNFPLKSGRISIFGLGGTSSITAIEDDEDRSSDSAEYNLKSINGSKTGILGANFSYNFNSNTFFKATLGLSTRRPKETVDSTLNNNAYLLLNDNAYSQNNIIVTTRLTKKLNVKNSATLGIIVQNMSFRAERMSSDITKNVLTIDKPYFIQSHNLVLSQAFFQWKHNFSDFLYVNGGFHGLYFHYNNTSAIDPRIGISWQITEKQSLGIGYGLHSQMQPLNLYFIRSKTGIDADGRQEYTDLGTNKNLDFTRSHQVAVSHNYSFNPDLRLKTEVYYQYLYNVPVKQSKGYFSMINTGAAMSIPEEDSLINEGYGKNYGIEFTFEKFLSQHYYFLVTTSLFNSIYKGTDKVWRNSAYNGHYVFNALGGYEFEIKKNVMFNTNIRCVYAGGRRITPYDVEKSIAGNETHYLYNQAFEKQVSAYFRVDARIGVVLQRTKTTHEFALDVVNVTNHKNVYRERYDPRSKGKKTNYHQGIFPMGLYRFNF